MSSLDIRRDDCQLHFLSLGSLVHRLDPGIVPFRKARSVDIHVSGGEQQSHQWGAVLWCPNEYTGGVTQ